MRKIKYLMLLALATLLLAACAAPAAEEEEPEEEPAAEEEAEEEAAEEEMEEEAEDMEEDMAEEEMEEDMDEEMEEEEEAAAPITGNVVEGRGGECLGDGGEYIVDLECDEITIAIENAYLPFNYVSLETGEPAGWDYDAIEEICTRLNCTPVFVEAAWEGMIQSVSEGQYDMAADGITITEERAEIVDFSVGYVNIDQRLMVRIDEDRFDNVDDFVAGDYTIGTQTGTTNFETATELVDEARIQAFEQFPFAVQALITGDVDAVIIDETAGQGYVGENADQIKLVGESLESGQLGFIYPLGSELVEPIDAAILAMIEDGTMNEINATYFGPGFDITYDDIGDGAYAE